MHHDTIFVAVFQLGMEFLIASPLVSWVLAQVSELVRVTELNLETYMCGAVMA